VGDDAPAERLTFWQRAAQRRARKAARKAKDEPLTSEDWAAYFSMASDPLGRTMSRMLRALPSSPRCGICGAPFSGFGARLVRPLGYRPSRKSPNLCATCVEAAPPGGMTTEAGVLFADIRGFTRLSEQRDPEEVSALLRRFYASAEHVLFPEAVIDKLIGDEVMAFFVRGISGPHYRDRAVRAGLDLLAAVGDAADGEPWLQVGVAVNAGTAFVGNVGEQVVDFTALGDTVNVCARMQGHAAGGELLVAAGVADHLMGQTQRRTLQLRDRPQPLDAFVLRAGGSPALRPPARGA
jgi:adenylate cyclase